MRIHALPPTGSRRAILEAEEADGTRTILELTLSEAYALPPAEAKKQVRAVIAFLSRTVTG
jgi:hypothetical protein